jgi:hypothetical protein
MPLRALYGAACDALDVLCYLFVADSVATGAHVLACRLLYPLDFGVLLAVVVDALAGATGAEAYAGW